jgi:hypothetical protein
MFGYILWLIMVPGKAQGPENGNITDALVLPVNSSRAHVVGTLVSNPSDVSTTE